MKQILSKKYWLRFSSNFFLFFFFYLIGYYFFREEGETFWSLKTLADKMGFSVFMALFVSYRSKSNEINEETIEITGEKPGWKDFLGIYFIMLLFATVLMTFLMLVGWAVLYFWGHNQEPFLPVYLKMLAVTAIMCFILHCVLFANDYFKSRTNFRKHSHR